MVMRMREVPIVGIDKQTRAFIGSDGRRYFEVDADIFAPDGVVEEGSVAFHGSGSHGGHIVLKPFYKRRQGSWVNMYAQATLGKAR